MRHLVANLSIKLPKLFFLLSIGANSSKTSLSMANLKTFVNCWKSLDQTWTNICRYCLRILGLVIPKMTMKVWKCPARTPMKKITQWWQIVSLIWNFVRRYSCIKTKTVIRKEYIILFLVLLDVHLYYKILSYCLFFASRDQYECERASQFQA